MRIFIGSLLCILALGATVARADIVLSGQTDPTTPAEWANVTSGYALIAESEAGSMTVNGGSDIITSVRAYVGGCTAAATYPNAVGVVTITGSGSTWTAANQIRMGWSIDASGEINILAGATLTAGRTYLGGMSGSSGKMTISGASGGVYSSATCSENFYIAGGANTTGNLEISGGGTLTSGVGVVAQGAGSVGIASVSGDGSSWFSPNMLVSYQGGAATLEITDGGLVGVEGMALSSAGTINMSTGGMLALAGDYDDDLATFFDEIDSGGVINYKDASDSWADITGATSADYTLGLQTIESVTYTVLTVGTTEVPEPGSVMLILSALFGIGCVLKWKK